MRKIILLFIFMSAFGCASRYNLLLRTYNINEWGVPVTEEATLYIMARQANQKPEMLGGVGLENGQKETLYARWDIDHNELCFNLVSSTANAGIRSVNIFGGGFRTVLKKKKINPEGATRLFESYDKKTYIYSYIETTGKRTVNNAGYLYRKAFKWGVPVTKKATLYIMVQYPNKKSEILFEIVLEKGHKHILHVEWDTKHDELCFKLSSGGGCRNRNIFSSSFRTVLQKKEINPEGATRLFESYDKKTYIYSNMVIIDDETDFKDMLSKFVLTTKKQDKDKCIDNFRKFSKNYPNSKYVDDAEFVILFMSSQGTENIDIKQWDDFANKYSNQKLEDYTKKELLNYFGKEESLIYYTNDIYIPYNLIAIHFKALNSFLNKNIDEGIKYTKELINRIDKKQEDMKKAAFSSYIDLKFAYIMADRYKEKEYKKLMKEMMILYPEIRQTIDYSKGKKTTNAN